MSIVAANPKPANSRPGPVLLAFKTPGSAPAPRKPVSGVRGSAARCRVRDLTDEEVNRIRTYVDSNLEVEGDLRREISQDIKRKIEIGCYQGLRHRRGLPVRGQRTRTNARQRKGPRKTVAGKKKVKK